MSLLQKGIYDKMRNIKFRGLSVRPDVAWVYGDVHFGVDNLKAHIHQVKGINVSCFVDPETIGQFTGLLDKNGVEVYGKDIVTFLDVKMVVEWRDCCAAWVLFSPKEPQYQYADMQEYVIEVGKDDWILNCEVIGNTTDTPKLITPDLTS